MKLLLIGFGVVGQGFAEILRDKSAELQRKHDFAATIIGVVTASKGSLYRPAGLDLSALLEAAASGSFDGYPGAAGLRRGMTALDMIAAGEADALVEVSPTNLDTAQPALDICHRALDAGMHLALANKGPVALGYASLQEKARAVERQLRYEATVMAGTPTMRLAEEALAGCAIRSARGILNGTTNYILTRMENGMSYDEALARAQELGYAESDPSGDVEGWDAAGKVLILANVLFGGSLKLADLDVSGITAISAADIADARAAGQRYKLIASATPDGGSVKATRLPFADPLASVGGSTNAITLETDLMGDVTLIGAGAGKLETGFAILSDLLAIRRATGAS
ncbi:MAG: homoserine dehydrogenase [Chloroflexota bacterium]|nr:homoserine dehydrogenase [Chloroflexota bacterium]MDE2909948.1 homoserine dehydrogenase [Chloroflexota bacterium]